MGVVEEITESPVRTCPKCDEVVGPEDQYCHACWAELTPDNVSAATGLEWQTVAFNLMAMAWIGLGILMIWATSLRKRDPGDFMNARAAQGSFVWGFVLIVVGVMLLLRVGVAFNLARVLVGLGMLIWFIAVFIVASPHTWDWWGMTIVIPLVMLGSWKLIGWAEPE